MTSSADDLMTERLTEITIELAKCDSDEILDAILITSGGALAWSKIHTFCIKLGMEEAEETTSYEDVEAFIQGLFDNQKEMEAE